MKLGVFDSGLGGIMIARAIRDRLPDIDMVYLGDTLHMPYGSRSEDAIFRYSRNAMEHLFDQHDCQLIIMACNTASASALRKLQQTYLPKAYPERRILGVVVPTIEYVLERGHTKLGLIGTDYTVQSNVYREELGKINSDIQIEQVNTPLLVPLIEHNGMQWVEDVLDRYLSPLVEKGIEALILSCTHYTCLKDIIRARYGFEVFSQDEMIPEKLDDYLGRHPEIESLIGKNTSSEFYVSDLTDSYTENAMSYYGESLTLRHTVIGDGS